MRIVRPMLLRAVRSAALRACLGAMVLAGCQTTGTAPTAAAPPPKGTASKPAVPPSTDSADFAQWLAGLRAEAVAQGIRPTTVDRAFARVRLSPRIIELDSAQPEFTRMVWSYLDSAVSDARVQKGRAKIQENSALFARVSREYGVPAEILAAFWGVESDFGRDTGTFAVVDALTTLAFNGRRAAYFRSELLVALKILDSGDIAPERMTGSWAGAMGQTQFMPTIFQRYAVDEDGDGRRDIWTSMPDVLASTARFVRGNNWQPGERWGDEVRLPAGFPYDQAELTVVKPVSEWRRMGVRLMNGAEPDGDATPAAILLLAGAEGPAFLVRENFRAIMRYNPSTSYALAVALLADRMAGRSGIIAPWPRHEQPLSKDERLELQQRLADMGYEPGNPDGIIGPSTRNAARRFQTAAGMVPDGFVTKALLERMRRGG